MQLRPRKRLFSNDAKSSNNIMVKQDARKRTFSKEKEATVRSVIESMLAKVNDSAPSKNNSNNGFTVTRSRWSLLDGLTHVALAHEGKLFPLIRKHGPPTFYFEPTVANTTSFHALCRIIVGQQLADGAVKKIWDRLQDAIADHLDDDRHQKSSSSSPTWDHETVLSMVGDDDDRVESRLQKPAGLSAAKARSIVDLARRYRRGELSDDLLLFRETSSASEKDDDEGRTREEDEIRSRLTKVKGLGPWSCDMFLMFHAQRPDVLPVGDLGVRKGSADFFGVKGKGKNGALCPKKDAALLEQLHASFRPYRSLSSFYMWRCLE